VNGDKQTNKINSNNIGEYSPNRVASESFKLAHTSDIEQLKNIFLGFIINLQFCLNRERDIREVTDTIYYHVSLFAHIKFFFVFFTSYKIILVYYNSLLKQIINAQYLCIIIL